MTAKITQIETHYFPNSQITVRAASIEKDGLFHCVLVGRSGEGFKPLSIGNELGKSAALADINDQLERMNASTTNHSQARLDNAVFAIDDHLIQIREAINIHHTKTQDDELIRITELINMSRETSALPPKVHGLLAVYTTCQVQATNHLFKETSALLRQTAADIGELLKNLIAKE